MEDTLINTTFSFADILQNKDFPVDIKPLTKKEERTLLMTEIYNYYKAENGKRKVENWKRYCRWCRENRLSDIKENQQKFKKTRMYIKEMSQRSIEWLLKHIPTKDLYYFTSTGREFAHSGKYFSGWLMMWIEKVER